MNISKYIFRKILSLNNSKDNIIYLLSFVWKVDKKFVFIKFVHAILAGIFPLVNVIFPKLILDDIMNRSDVEIISKKIFIFAIIQILYYWFQLLISYYDSINSIKLINKINNEVLQKIITVDLAYFECPDFYDSYYKAKNEAGTRAKNSFDRIFSIFSSIITVFSVSYILLLLGPYVMALLIGVIFISTYIMTLNKKATFNYMNSVTKYNRETGYFYNLLASPNFSKELRVFNSGNWIISKYNERINKVNSMFKIHQKKVNLLDCSNQTISKIEDSIIYLILAYKAVKGRISIGDFTMHLMAIQNFTQRLFLITAQISNLYEDSLFVENLKVFLSTENKIISGTKLPDISNRFPDPLLEFKNVSFKYPGQTKFIFRNLSFKIYHNEKALIAGKNGAGKSTLTKLILRLYDPDEGEIFFNGINIKEFSIEEYRNIFGTVLQDYNKYAFSIIENVKMGEIKANDHSRINDAIANSGLNHKIDSLPHGINTTLTREFDKEGIDLSVGEMQKLALARAYAKEPLFYILDEPTSALDPLAEEEMYINYLNVSKGKTSIFIAHRLSVSRFMDKIIIIGDEGIEEVGTHNELMMKNGKYRFMYEMQSEKYCTFCS